MRLLVGARKLVQDGDPLGAIPLLASSTGLSRPGVSWALDTCLEVDPGEEELQALLSHAPVAPAAHVLLSSNVFVAAHRALALALASSDRVFVRPSRREPEMVALLQEAAEPGLFRVVDRLTPVEGDVVYAYGSDATLGELRKTWPHGVLVQAHGSGLGAAVCELSQGTDAELEEAADLLATDIALFDQRGCLSPRVCLVRAPADVVMRLAEAVRDSLDRLERRVPRGLLHSAEVAEIRRHTDTWTYAGHYLEARAGGVSVDLDSGQALPSPTGRTVHIVRVASACDALLPMANTLTSVGVQVGDELRAKLVAALPAARVTELGRVQRPPLDGPVDRRPRSLEWKMT